MVIFHKTSILAKTTHLAFQGNDWYLPYLKRNKDLQCPIYCFFDPCFDRRSLNCLFSPFIEISKFTLFLHFCYYVFDCACIQLTIRIILGLKRFLNILITRSLEISLSYKSLVYLIKWRLSHPYKFSTLLISTSYFDTLYLSIYWLIYYKIL